MGCFSLVSSCLSWASRPSPRSSLRLSARPACLPHTPMRFSSAHRLIGSPRVPLLVSSARLPHRRLAFFFAALIGSPLASYRPAPRPIRHDGRGGAKTQSATGGHRRCADGGERMAAAACLPRMETTAEAGRAVIGGASLRRRGLFACLGAMDGAARSFLDRFSFPLIGSSNRLGPGSFHHLIVPSHRRGGTFSPFSPAPPPRLLFSACLLWLVPPAGDGGCEGLCHGLRRWAFGLLACVLAPRSLSRCRSFARCYMLCVARAARSYLGCCEAFFGLF